MGDDIRTRWHDWLGTARQGNLLVENRENGLSICSKHPSFDTRSLMGSAESLSGLPHYFLTQDCIRVLEGEACLKSIRALHKVGMLRLPHPSCAVEFDDPDKLGSDRTRYIVLVTERTSPLIKNEEMYHPFRCEVFQLYQPDYSDKNSSFRKMRDAVDSGRGIPLWTGNLPKIWPIAPQFSYMFGIADRTFIQKSNGELIPEGHAHYGVIAAPWIKDMGGMSHGPEKSHPDSVQRQGTVALVALRALLMLIRTQGVERSVVRSDKLNRARSRRGQVPVPEHTVVYLGYYTTRTGERVRYDPTKPGHQFQGVHARSGHTRRVWHGSGDSRRAVVQYIEPYLVNYTEGDPVPTPRRKVVRPSPVVAGLAAGGQG